ncbi:hypothetical protein A3E04_02825 [Candidatus Kuenenbacteria bacterium RIFCSPHIGHO2_12_FULL_42_14]|uniref:DUF4340 domain-containing protein n=4 Tax=Candidatus Kueneniibacteriota TaxID=1752740 RepID=A0A0G1B731_9BACT|nr:MAG: hypothetical protein UV02_C0020G0012 [Candidatus Kuenenbacteria bacterium GW2011_GWA2_42_15]OGG89610.1 MAG: hypothetical protein A3C68_01640 [Candidatus Kuenenbacteria bacterium RIFCSPHIGHO2_02_FULL_42_29]OGG91547.1 MAG: hypothetical protein A3H55_00320 [Candidatus Kuenenbacteria bacterium RIFCSPLOWO2_02_FULL_42_16]OGG95601.1 MAG: hypothetical protein A2V95_03385 [Candidatus Kuenenbacteria bacterium RBG_16_41_7]OGG98439.1 MAG: hypothetical protein A3E04_02825 [Candidatus Kuenenbacteria 
MKKLLLFFMTLVLMFSFASSTSAANSITSRLKGKLLLQVQDKGRIWYVDPVGLQKHEVTFSNALSLFQKLALGITNADLIKIPADLDSINPNLDSDNDGYPDKEELQNGYSPYIAGSNQGRFKTDNNLAAKLKGRLLLQVQDKGRIWYIDQNGKRWEVTWGNLMSLFRKLALGITDKDLNEVGNVETANWQTYTNSEYGYEIKYPSDLVVNEKDNANIFFLTKEMYDGFKSGQSAVESTFWINVSSFLGEISLDEIGKTLLPNTKDFQKEYITVGEKRFLKMHEPGEGAGTIIYYSSKDSSLISFGILGGSNFDLEKILSTFSARG